MNRRSFIAGAAAMAVAPRGGGEGAAKKQTVRIVPRPPVIKDKPGEWTFMFPRIVAIHGATITVEWMRETIRMGDYVFKGSK